MPARVLSNVQFSRLLINTSGSGKTRLLFEGLARNWGFYFSAAVDTAQLGSADIQDLIEKRIPRSKDFTKSLPESSAVNFMDLLEHNRNIVQRRFSQVVLARLLCFHEFLRAAKHRLGENFEREQKRLKLDWLILQLFPDSLTSTGYETAGDIFVTLANDMQLANDHFLKNAIDTTISKINHMLYPIAGAQVGFHKLFFVLDEAQELATRGFSSFRAADGVTRRSSLRDVSLNLRSIPGITTIISGTGLSLKEVQQTLETGVEKELRFRTLHNTGWFGDKAAQLRYLKLYLPQEYLDSEQGRRLSSRIATWLCGRY